MENFNQSADFGKQLIFKFLKERMKEKGISQYKLAQLTEVKEATLSQNFNNISEMSLTTFLKICGALEINPFLVPKELNKKDMQRLFFS